MYNESIKDLFVEPGRPATAANKHDVRLDKKGRVYVEGLVECEVSACVRDLSFIPVLVFGQHLECLGISRLRQECVAVSPANHLVYILGWRSCHALL